MRVKQILLLSFIVFHFPAAAQENQKGIVLETVPSGLMKYYVSLPEHWTPGKTWPVIVSLESAEKDYIGNVKRFQAARGDKPYIIICPFIVNNGSAGKKDPKIYPYDLSTWNRIDEMGDCEFDLRGIIESVEQVNKKYHGDHRFYITGFESGAHSLWAMVFLHPELVIAAVPVAGNYIGRCINNNSFNRKADRALPICGFTGDKDFQWGAGSKLYGQWLDASKLAKTNGYDHISTRIIKGKGHEPMPDEVLNYFSSLKQQ